MEKSPKRKFYLKQFRAISHAISTYENPDVLISHLAEGTTRTFDAKGCTIMLFDENEKQLFPVSSYGVSGDYLDKGPLLVDERYTSFVTGSPVFIQDMQNDPRVQYPEAAAKEGIVSMLSIPIQFRTEAIGLIRIYLTDNIPLHDEDVETLAVMAEHLGLVIENNGLKNFLDQVRSAIECLPSRMLEGYRWKT